MILQYVTGIKNHRENCLDSAHYNLNSTPSTPRATSLIPTARRYASQTGIAAIARSRGELVTLLPSPLIYITLSLPTKVCPFQISFYFLLCHTLSNSQLCSKWRHSSFKRERESYTSSRAALHHPLVQLLSVQSMQHVLVSITTLGALRHTVISRALSRARTHCNRTSTFLAACSYRQHVSV